MAKKSSSGPSGSGRWSLGKSDKQWRLGDLGGGSPARAGKRKKPHSPKRRSGTTRRSNLGRKFNLGAFARNKFARFALGVCLIGGIALFFGSIAIRYRVIELVKERTLQSSATVVGRAFPLEIGTDVKRSNVFNRLRRLRYQQISGSPEHAGQYSVANGKMEIFLRGITTAKPAAQKSEVVRISFKQGTIDSIGGAYGQARDTVWLEPEMLAQLGRTSTRASTPKELTEFNPLLVKALLAVEDERFRYHFGIDPVGILRAVWSNYRAGHLVQGGSTLTQQLAKNLFTGGERTLARKIKEAIAAVMLETAFTKDQILELYLNEVFLAQEGQVAIHGFGEASLTFFGKEASELNAAQAATLAGLVKAPSAFSPRSNPKRAKERRDIVLEKMYEEQIINKSQFDEAVASEISVREPTRVRRIAPYFVDYLTRLLTPAVQKQGVDIRPLTIHTGIDPEYQHCAAKAVQTGLDELIKQFPRIDNRKRSPQAALLSVIPETGEIRAWVGGKNYSENQFDRVSLAKRQPGSAFKPFVYLTALDRNLNDYRVARTTSLLTDEPVAMRVAGAKTWEPQNYDKQFRGDVTFRQALAQSLNVPTVQLATKVGIDRVARTAELFGFGKDLPQVPALALGAGEVTPYDLTRAYAALANGGKIPALRPILSVTRDADVVYRAELIDRRVASEQATFVLTDMLRSVVENGTARVVRTLGYTGPVAGKTGTTNDARDAWFAAYTPHLLAVVWVGYDDNEPLGLTGGQAAAPLWTRYMKCVEPFEPRGDFVPPDGVVFRKVDLASGLLATEDCPAEDVVNEVFVGGTEPQTACPLHSQRQRTIGDPDFESDRAPSERSPSNSRGPVSDFIDKLFN